MPQVLLSYVQPDPAFDHNKDRPSEAYSHIRACVVKFDPPDEEVFLLYSKRFERGPIIRRTGDRSPSMRRMNAPWEETTDPEEQRLGTWFVRKDCRRQEEKRLEKVLDGVRKEAEDVSGRGGWRSTKGSTIGPRRDLRTTRNLRGVGLNTR